MTFLPRLSPAFREAALAAPLALALVLGLHGCADGELADGDPAAMMKEAEEEIESSRYQLAVDRLRMIKNKHPYSKQATDAQLRLGDVYFLQESYGEAAAQYEAFKDLHPKHERAGYASFRIALSYYNDIPSVVARDQTPAARAQEAFRDYLAEFPNGENSAEARDKLAETRKVLAEKEMYIADFYRREEKWESAQARYEKVIGDFGDTPLAALARERLAKVEAKIKAAEGKAGE